MYGFGEEGDYNIMILELLGPSLEYIFKKYNRTFTQHTIFSICLQLVLSSHTHIDKESFYIA